jgi:hypothetical protein
MQIQLIKWWLSTNASARDGPESRDWSAARTISRSILNIDKHYRNVLFGYSYNILLQQMFLLN